MNNANLKTADGVSFYNLEMNKFVRQAFCALNSKNKRQKFINSIHKYEQKSNRYFLLPHNKQKKIIARLVSLFVEKFLKRNIAFDYGSLNTRLNLANQSNLFLGLNFIFSKQLANELV